MAKWSVIIWATVTPDLEESMARDLKEAMIALDALGPGADIHVHSYLHRPGVRDPQVLPAGGVTDDPFVSADLSAVLSRTTCWKDKERQRLLVFWGHGTRAFPPSMLGFTTTAEEKAAAKKSVMSAELAAEELDGGSSFERPDIIGYDACRMASVKTVLSFANVCSDAIFVGSMVPEPASGWPYFELLRILGEDWKPPAVASALVEAYAASVDANDWCMIAMDLNPIKAGIEVPAPGVDVLPLEAALGNLFASTPPDPVDFLTAAQGADILDDTNFADLGALMSRLDPAEVRGQPGSEASEVRRTLRSAILTRRAGGSLAGRDGVAVLVGLPWDVVWPDRPTWEKYFPDIF